MAHLNSISLQFTGEFRDFWLYKGHLYAWQRDGKLLYCELKRIVDYVATQHGPAVANVVQTLIARNDWKASEQFRSMMAAPSMQSAFLEPFREDARRIINIPFGLLSSSPTEPYSGLVLDTTIYADHVFFATSEGLLQTFVSPEDPELEFPLHQHNLNVRATGVSVRYSAVNVSAEDEGLHFGRMSSAAAEQRRPHDIQFRELAKFSRQSSYASQDLLNYGESAAPALFRAKVREREESTSSSRTERFEILDYQDPIALDSLTFTAAATRKRVTRLGVSPVDTEGMEVLGNNNGQMLLSWNDRFRVVRMSILRDTEGDRPEDIQAKPSSGFKDLEWAGAKPSETLQTLPVNKGFVVELEDSVALIQNDGVFSLLEGAVAQLRTFASSIRHKEVVASVEESTGTITGYYPVGDTLF